MFDHARTRPTFSDHLGLLVVLLVVLASLAAVPLAGIDFERPAPHNALVARSPNASRLATSDPLVLVPPPSKSASEVSSSGSL